MQHTRSLISAAAIALLLPASLSAQPDGTELAASGLFLGRYVAAVAPLASTPTAIEEVKVLAPRVRASDDLLEEISRDLDEALEARLASSVPSGSR